MYGTLMLDARLNRLPDGFVFDARQKALDDAELHVCFEERLPHFMQRRLNIVDRY